MNDIELDKKVKQIVHAMAYEKGIVSIADVLIDLAILTKKDYELWRFGKIAYLERACSVNLVKLTKICKTVRKTATDLKLEKSWTGYYQYGKGVKRKLIFSKSGKKEIEDAYATHHINRSRIYEIKMSKVSLKNASKDISTASSGAFNAV